MLACGLRYFAAELLPSEMLLSSVSIWRVESSWLWRTRPDYEYTCKIIKGMI